jgi:hypothetical protein
VTAKLISALLSRNFAKSREDFYEEARKPRIIRKHSWFPGFLMDLFLVAALDASPLCIKQFSFPKRTAHPASGFDFKSFHAMPKIRASTSSVP